MKRNTRELLIIGGIKLLTWSEKGLEYLFTKAKKTKDLILAKLKSSSKKAAKNEKIKQSLSLKVKQREAQIDLANLTTEKSKNQNITKTRLNELEQTGVGKELENQYEP